MEITDKEPTESTPEINYYSQCIPLIYIVKCIAFWPYFIYSYYAMSRTKKKIRSETRERIDLGLSQETINGIWGVVALGIAVVAALAFWDKAGPAGRLFTGISRALFGIGMFIIPIALVMLGIAFLKSIHRKVNRSAIVGTLLFVLSSLSIFYIWGIGDRAIRLAQGGYFGWLLGNPALRWLGFPAALVIFIFLLVVSMLVTLNVPVHKILFWRRELGDEEEKGADKVAPKPLQDNVVIKRGSEIIDGQAESLKPVAAKPVSSAASAANVAKKSEEEKDFVIKVSKSGKWIYPPVDMLHSDHETPRSGDINANVAIIKRTLSNFGIDVEMGEVSIGPTVTQFTLRPAVGVKLSRITALQSDLSLALAAHPIRIEAPIPGKPLVGIEVPNKKTALVGLRDLIDVEDFRKSKYFLPLALGRDVAGFPVYAGLEKMPHMLIAGATGTGKSVTINTLLLSLLYKHSPDMLKLILVDPKRVELTLYNGIPHLVTPVIVDTKKVVNALRWAVREMEKRYERLSEIGSRDIMSFNVKSASEKKDLMPYIVIVIDELADLMASHGKDVEAAIVRLAQMARAVGIHLIVSTQRPSVEVITGLIKANITSRVALQVASQIDSRTILDNSGAEKLLGNGDMLYQSGDTNSKMRRVQGAFVSEKEVKDVVDFIRKQAGEMEGMELEKSDGDLRAELNDAVAGTSVGADDDVDDDMFLQAKDTVIQMQKASASLLQRRLRVGYARAARLLDLLEERGVIGPGEGAKPREVFVSREGGGEPANLTASSVTQELQEEILTKEE